MRCRPLKIPVMWRCYRNFSIRSQAAKLISVHSPKCRLHHASTIKRYSVLNNLGEIYRAQLIISQRQQSVLQSQRFMCCYSGALRCIPRTTTSVTLPPNSKKISSRPSNDQNEKNSQEIIQSTSERPETQLTVGAKVVQAGKDVSYFAVILVGFAITGALIWYVASELLFGFSPNKVYSDALKKVKENSEVINAVGEPMKAYGEETARGRRRHVSYQEYIVNGENYMRVKFYISGPKQKGTVHVDVKQGSRGNYEFRFIFVEFKGFPGTVIVLDNR